MYIEIVFISRARYSIAKTFHTIIHRNTYKKTSRLIVNFDAALKRQNFFPFHCEPVKSLTRPNTNIKTLTHSDKNIQHSLFYFYGFERKTNIRNNVHPPNKYWYNLKSFSIFVLQMVYKCFFAKRHQSIRRDVMNLNLRDAEVVYNKEGTPTKLKNVFPENCF